MFSEIPKLFDRYFALGYVLPSAYFFVVLIMISNIVLPMDFLGPLTTLDPVFGTAAVVVLVWIGGALLVVFNYVVYRLCEGYIGPYKWFHRYLSEQTGKFNELKRICSSFENSDNSAQETDVRLRLDYQTARRMLALRFPEDESDILPTEFGNTVRSFETYPLSIYGFELTNGWDRLRAVVPQDYTEYINNAKSLTDFWVNIWAITTLHTILCLAIGVIIVVLYALSFLIPSIQVSIHNHTAIIILILALCAIYKTSKSFAVLEAVGWGNTIRATVDVFLPDLGERLAIGRNATREDWERKSQVFTYRYPEDADSNLMTDV